ncbi:LysR family transcriptional regulator [Inmirania thermothiophila]|uniref:DNA-binding transcriptional LysR family regulator n=1 Tax=Inmirania thermothiophila TaxID=1750597 RepID=A0A3N1Y668_9GAMM|nr:LysR family transcriptional regulator [Inmirania thermothiophila]ROR34309.1 DNA-binding transcriptional LysR family regulator [Inmirania thermothiophila]
MDSPVVTLDQWNTFVAVVEQGGFAQAAKYLGCSQSAVSYNVGKLQERLGVQLFAIEGRKAILTDAGRSLLDRARALVQDALALEAQARQYIEGYEAEIRLVVDKAFPTDILVAALGRFARTCKDTLVHLEEAVTTRVEEAVVRGQTDLGIGSTVPKDYLADHLLDIRLVAVAHPEHPLHKLRRPLTREDLMQETQVVISDSWASRKADSSWVGTSGKWYVASLETSLAVIRSGAGYGWLPKHMIEEAVRRGELKPLPLAQGKSRRVPLYLIYTRDYGPKSAVTELANILKELVRMPASERAAELVPPAASKPAAESGGG